MADALFAEILDAVVDVLNTDRPADVPEVTRRRMLPGVNIEEPRMGVFLGDEQLDPPRGSGNQDPLARRRLPIAVQCAAPTDIIEELDRIVEPMLLWSTQVLGLRRFKQLGATMRETGTQRRPEYLDLYIMTATQIYECTYITRRDNLTVRS